jgi:hypothetical protein
LLYASGTSSLSGLASVSNGVLVTSGIGVPSISTNLPSAVQTNITQVGTVTSGTWNGGVIGVSYGGTGLTSLTTNQLLYASGTSSLSGLTSASNGVLVTSGSGVPSISTNLPSAVQTNITQVGTVTSGTWNGSAVGVSYGGTGLTSLTANAIIYASSASALSSLTPPLAQNRVLVSNLSSAPSWSTITLPSSTTSNRLLYSSSANTISEITSANNGVLVTSSGGVPSISSTLPSAVQTNITQVGTVTSGTWNGSVIGVSYGGTGLTSLTTNQLLYASGTSSLSGLASASNGVLVTSGAGVPSISSTLPSAVQTNITQVGTVTSGTWNGSVIGVSYGGTGLTSLTTNQLLYASGTSSLSGLASASNGVLVTSGAGVPSISTTLPSAVQTNITQVGTVTSGTWNGSAVGVSYGGTGLTSLTANAIIYASSASSLSTLTPPTAQNRVLVSNLSNAPSWSTSSLALAGNFSTSGNNALTLTTTAATNVTLPVSGTLATFSDV